MTCPRGKLRNRMKCEAGEGETIPQPPPSRKITQAAAGMVRNFFNNNGLRLAIFMRWGHVDAIHRNTKVIAIL